MKTITLNQLREHGACKDQVELFEKMFGESVEITVELCESVASLFSFHWAAVNLLNDAAYAWYRRSRSRVRFKYRLQGGIGAMREYHRALACEFAEAYLKQEEPKS